MRLELEVLEPHTIGQLVSARMVLEGEVVAELDLTTYYPSHMRPSRGAILSPCCKGLSEGFTVCRWCHGELPSHVSPHFLTLPELARALHDLLLTKGWDTLTAGLAASRFLEELPLLQRSGLSRPPLTVLWPLTQGNNYGCS